MQPTDPSRLQRPEEAEAHLRRTLAHDPLCVDARHSLAQLLIGTKRSEEAARLLREGVRLLPSQPTLRNHLGVALRTLGRPEEALTAFDAAIALVPGQAEFHLNRASALEALGREEEALAAFRRAIECDPRSRLAHQELARLLLKRGGADEAVALCASLAHLLPDDVDALNLAAVVAQRAGRLEEAVGWYRLAVTCQPEHGALRANLCQALIRTGQMDEAITEGRLATRLAPQSIGAHANLARALADLGRITEALNCMERASALQPQNPDYHAFIASMLQQLERDDEAISRLEHAINLAPDYADAHHRLGLLLLRRGDYARGWAENEWRLRGPEVAPREPIAPTWEGKPMPGGTLLIYAEQGLGDAIQFARLLPLARERSGARILFACPRALIPLLQNSDGIESIVPQGEESLRSATCDAQAALLSLPYLLGVNADFLPAEIPYVRVAPAVRDRWRARLASGSELKVGLRWAGNPAFVHDRFRSCRLEEFAPLASVPGVRFFSLQTDVAAADVTRPPAGMQIEDLAPELTDLAETAGALSALDLVISTCTMIPHLAGALGVPVWIALHHAPHWVWQTKRDDSPWYPSARLFRQPRAGDWNSVFTRMADALTARTILSGE